MLFLLGLVGLPIAYLVVVVSLLVRGNPRGVGLSLVFCVASIATGIWAITQSRSSTAGIGFIGIPMLGALAGFLGLAFGRWRQSSETPRRIGAWLGLAGALFLVSFNIAQGAQTRTKNRGRDEKQAAHSAEIARDRELIDAALKENSGRQRAWLDSSMHARINDRAFLLAALPNDSVSPGILDTLANSDDLGIALEAVRNPNTTAETLTRVYRTRTYPDYFFQALAAHHHTPPEIIRDLYTRERTISGLDMWFAGNPATPKDILRELATKPTDKYVLAQLLENPALDCELLGKVAVTLMKTHGRDGDDPSVMRASELVPTVCPQKTKS
ncbi:MAG: hypothetical protein ACJ799_02615 [Gemmatimonadaceae bacterium]